MTRFNSKYTAIFLHVFLWTILLTLPHLFIDNRNRLPGSLPPSFYMVTNMYHIGLFYGNAFVLYPLFFNRKRWWLYIPAIALILFLSYFLKLFMAREWYPAVSLDKELNAILFFPPLPFLVVSTIYRLIVDRNAFEKKQKEIMAETLTVKLKFLRSQISPHFIFNVLTNLVSLARKRSEQLEPLLIKLSELMRYFLYESDEKKVSLSREIDYLRSYIDLQELRFGHDVAIDLDVGLSEKELNRSIEPMLLIPFVENAFKHGAGVDQPFIKIKLAGKEGGLEFDVTNKFSDDVLESKDMSSGIGLENVRSRLALLYPHEHTLIVRNEGQLFHIHLTLQLK
jgi:two-component system LytT family sensor kinase